MRSVLRKLPRFRKFKSFDEMPTWATAFLGIAAVLPGLYYWTLVTKVTPSLIDATDKAGFAWVGIALWMFDEILALCALHLLWIAKRCGEVFYKRLYK